jgi:hypothetical protein
METTFEFNCLGQIRVLSWANIHLFFSVIQLLFKVISSHPCRSFSSGFRVQHRAIVESLRHTRRFRSTISLSVIRSSFVGPTYLPRHAGLRFSRNARAPSFRSSDRTTC